jgi:hypothetical protein
MLVTLSFCPLFEVFKLKNYGKQDFKEIDKVLDMETKTYPSKIQDNKTTSTSRYQQEVKMI